MLGLSVSGLGFWAKVQGWGFGLGVWGCRFGGSS